MGSSRRDLLSELRLGVSSSGAGRRRTGGQLLLLLLLLEELLLLDLLLLGDLRSDSDLGSLTVEDDFGLLEVTASVCIDRPGVLARWVFECDDRNFRNARKNGRELGPVGLPRETRIV